MAIFSKNYWLALRSEMMKGFTMIELLVVITIIGLLAAAAGANYMTSLKRGRDTQRRGDMQKVQQAFEQYYGANQKYNANCTTMATGFFVGSYPPVGPRGETYTINCTSDGYCACALLEMTGKGNSPTAACGYTGAGMLNYYCVSSLQ